MIDCDLPTYLRLSNLNRCFNKYGVTQIANKKNINKKNINNFNFIVFYCFLGIIFNQLILKDNIIFEIKKYSEEIRNLAIKKKSKISSIQIIKLFC